jgi:hypothetical protein
MSAADKTTGRSRLFTFLSALGAAVVLGAFAWFLVVTAQETAAANAAMANSKIVMAEEPTKFLTQRVDGSFYTVTTGPETGATVYEFTTMDDEGIVRNDSISDNVVVRGLAFEMTKVDVRVQLIPSSSDERPRIETKACTIKPIDPSKPHFTDSPTSRINLTVGSDERTAENAQLCTDQVAIHVPEGTVPAG